MEGSAKRNVSGFARGAKPRAASRSVRGPVPDDAVQGVEGVLQADLLPLLVGPPGVADRDLVNAPGRAAPGDLGRHLRLEAEPVGAQLHPLDHLAAEQL